MRACRRPPDLSDGPPHSSWRSCNTRPSVRDSPERAPLSPGDSKASTSRNYCAGLIWFAEGFQTKGYQGHQTRGLSQIPRSTTVNPSRLQLSYLHCNSSKGCIPDIRGRHILPPPLRQRGGRTGTTFSQRPSRLSPNLGENLCHEALSLGLSSPRS
ncbi:hypothetical protein CALCODRAFT_344774 [Calocera cornea HHB12733]|uniref:Uncharacterized protein n=1 Tax=Calocera cornea HHB12733 TaxID=1353952 RepID=A0A165EWB9_9BASI|nr:hypothetical protein CALCODRAFT_344774 [Calocera cornea HHB12733]